MQIDIVNVVAPLVSRTITPKATLFPEKPCWANNYGIFIVPRNGITYGEILEYQGGMVPIYENFNSSEGGGQLYKLRQTFLFRTKALIGGTLDKFIPSPFNHASSHLN